MKSRILSSLILIATLGGAAAPVIANEAAGAYLAARQARYDSDYTAAVQYLTRALTKDPSNPDLLDPMIAAQISLGRISSALPVANRIEDLGFRSQVAEMAILADLITKGEYAAVLERIKEDRAVSPLADGLIAAWSTLGNGDMSSALKLFDSVAQESGLRSFALYHKALALASVGDFESADRIYSGEAEGPMQTTRRGTIAWAEVLSQLERNDDAVKAIDDTFGSDLDPQLAQLRARLVAGDRVPFAIISGAQDGIAEVFYSLGRALLNETGAEYALLYTRIAEHLSETHIDARIMTAELLETLERYELATEAYRRVPRDHPSFYVAEMGRAETLRRAGKTDAAVEVLLQLSETHPDIPLIHAATGDLYRQLEQFDKAVKFYDRAIDLFSDRNSPQWFVYYARAISFERLNIWDDAEADFRRALELSPDQPEVLNYLGYSLVEKQIKLDEALGMIEQAVAARPDSGFIVDSLGWVLYRLGRYDEAIVHMERAAALMPVDPVVNDHLGDVLWAVGRYNEAEFQWRRALSFVDEENPSPDVKPDRMRRKLEVGLDRVLEEEGAPALKMVKEDG